MASSPPPIGNGEGRSLSNHQSRLRPTETDGSAPLRSDSASTPRDIFVALTYGLELVRHGAMLVAGGGNTHIANTRALSILQKQDGIAWARTGLVADRASDTRLLHKLLHEAMVSPESGEPKESPITLERKLSRSALIVRVVPGPSLACWQGPEQKTALLRIYDRDMGLVVDEHALISLYGLTRGEAALAAKLVEGKSIEVAATELFISPHTARTHLKRIFMKTDTHRQPELVVRMLLTIL
jgi:DNA-binding CsgD family transcriptional regulator